MNKKILMALGLLAACGSQGFAQSTYYLGDGTGDVTTVIDLAVDPTGTYGGFYDAPTKTWVIDGLTDTYILNELVFIKGGTLQITPGSIIRGQPKKVGVTTGPSGDFNPGALIIAADAKLIADGTIDQPIIFTTASVSTLASPPTSGDRATGSSPVFWDIDPVNSPKGADKGALWGGVVILGNAPINSDKTPLTPQQYPAEGGTGDDRFPIEGIPASSAANVAGLDLFGGNDVTDNSGILRYVSIRHGGASLNANNELNGLTMGGVGRGTTVEYIEIWGNTDDAIELFGGTVNMKYLAMFGSQDDSLDLDTGWTGTAQFVLTVAGNGSDKIAEWDGSYEGETYQSVSGPVSASLLPVANYNIVNATFLANPASTAHVPPSTTTVHDGSQGFHIRDQSAPRFVNSIVVGYRLSTQSLRIDNRGTQDYQDSPLRFVQGLAEFRGVTLWDPTGSKSTAADWLTPGTAGDEAGLVTAFEAAARQNVFNLNPGFANVPDTASEAAFTSGSAINPVPNSSGAGNVAAYTAVLDDAIAGYNADIKVVAYRGAFAPGLDDELWTSRWTAADKTDFIVAKGNGTN